MVREALVAAVINPMYMNARRSADGKQFVSHSAVDAEARCYRCPDCGSTNVSSTVKTVYSTYCRCGACGSIWHEDRQDPPSDKSPKRRSGDLA